MIMNNIIIYVTSKMFVGTRSFLLDAVGTLKICLTVLPSYGLTVSYFAGTPNRMYISSLHHFVGHVGTPFLPSYKPSSKSIN
jgi:hypothetical protein